RTPYPGRASDGRGGAPGRRCAQERPERRRTPGDPPAQARLAGLIVPADARRRPGAAHHTDAPGPADAALSLRHLREDGALGRSRHLAVCGLLAAPPQRRARDVPWCWWRDAALHHDGCQGGAPVSPLRWRLAVWSWLAALYGVCETGGGQPMTRP